MAEIVQKIIPLKLQLDISENYRDAFNAQFIQNVRANLNINSEATLSGNANTQGGNVQNQTPTQSNEIICADIVLPAGNNICTGAFESKETAEIYFEVWNDEDNFSLWVYGTEIQQCRKVYEGECLAFRFEPEYHIPEHRSALFVVYDSDGNGNRTIKNKYYIFTDGVNWQRFIDVESSIATDSYNPISFPYFRTYYPHCDPCEFIQLGIRPPRTCSVVLPFDDDTDLQFYEDVPENNNLLQKVWYFATSFIDVFGRHSVLSPHSTPVYINGGDCSVNGDDLKCFRLQLDAGGAFVDKIVVYFSNDGVNFFQYDIIDKYEYCQSPAVENFWERDLALHNYFALNSDSPPCGDTGSFPTFTYTWDLSESPQLDFTSASIEIDGQTYTNNELSGFHGFIQWLNGLNKGQFNINSDIITTSSASIVYGDITINNSPPEIFSPVIAEVDQTGTANTFIYQFCANKSCIPIDPKEVERIFDDLPIASVAQAIIDDRLAYGNNLNEYDNFICPIENITIEAVQDDAICSAGMVKLTIRAVIENFAEERNNPITQLASSTDIAFGGYGSSATIDSGIISDYNQRIVNQYKGFIGGLRGTPYKTVSKQYRIGDPSHVYGVPQAPSSGVITDAYNGNYFYQEWVFIVPKNTYYIFEIYSHLATDLSNCEGTSTYFYGTIDPNNYLPSGDIRSSLEGTALRELLIPACGGDYIYPNYVVIADLSQSNARAIGGYLREQDTNLAVELADSEFATGTTTIQTVRTDANGFWFAMSKDGEFQPTISVTGGDCNVKTAVSYQTDGSRFLAIDKVVPLAGAGLSDYNTCCHSLLTGKVVDCDGFPISGVPVMLTRTGRVSMSDTEGNFTIVLHDDTYALFNFSHHRQGDTVVFGTKGACLFTNGCNCNPCLEARPVNFNYCFVCPVVTQTLGEFTLGKIIPDASHGLKTGGTYAVSIIGFDYLGRNNAAQRIGFFDVPNIQSNGVYAPYHFTYNFGQLNLDLWVKEIRFAIRGNNEQFLLSWATNKVEFVDAAGNITAPEVAVNIKIYIDDLNDFNTQNFFNTNTNYQWVAGDRLRVVANGDNVTYLTATNGGIIDLPVSKLENGNVLLVPFDSRLVGLTANAVFQLYRIPVCTTEPVYWEQCPSIAVLFNETTQSYEPVTTSGTIPFFDTYWFYRSIPMVDKDGVPYVFTSPHPYEHHSPSDFWGDHLFSIGRAFVRNPNQRQTWHLDDVAYSESLLQDGIINGLATWRTENKKEYVVQGAAGIVALRAQTGLLYALCENNWFVANISQNLLLVTSDGNVQANPDYLGNKQQKIGNIYGCDLRDTSTIIFRQEWIMWADTKRNAICKSNYQTVWDVTESNDASSGGTKSYWIEKFKALSDLRNQNQFTDGFMFLHSAYDPKSDEYIITSFIRNLSPDEIPYGTDARDYSVESNETLSFNLGGFWSGTYSFTPEQMISFDSGKDGVQLIAFKQGKAYIHHKLKSTGITFNNFFGTQYQPIIKFVVNGGEGNNETQKRFLAMRILCKESLFYSDEIVTQAFQFSQLPIEESTFGEQYSEVGFLCDIYTTNPQGISALIDGTSLFGSWIKIRLLIDPNNIANYFELNGIIVSSTESY